jgi:hypothetical protein
VLPKAERAEANHKKKVAAAKFAAENPNATPAGKRPAMLMGGLTKEGRIEAANRKRLVLQYIFCCFVC